MLRTLAILLVLSGSALAQSPPQVQPEDIAIAPQRFVQRHITITGLRCTRVEARDYRCVPDGPAPVVFYSRGASPDSVIEHMERHCSTVRRMASGPCRFNVSTHLLMPRRDTTNDGRAVTVFEGTWFQMKRR